MSAVRRDDVRRQVTEANVGAVSLHVHHQPVNQVTGGNGFLPSLATYVSRVIDLPSGVTWGFFEQVLFRTAPGPPLVVVTQALA